MSFPFPAPPQLPSTAHCFRGLKNGQFAELQLEPAGSGNEDLNILYSTRAACYLKKGNCSDYIQELHS